MLTADVVIVGGGPGGLSAAHALSVAAPHLRLAVLERTRELSRRGAGLGLDVNGQKALRAISPRLHERVMEMAAFLRANKVLRADGSLISEVPLSSPARAAYERQGLRSPCLMGWAELQRMLYDELPGREQVVRLGAEFDRYELDPSGELVTVHVRDGGPPVRASLLVASDGYFSRVRRQLLGDGAPQWGRSVVWRARLPAAAASAAGLPLGDCSVMVQGDGRFHFSYPISSGDCVWTVGVSDDKLAEFGLEPGVLLEHLRGGGAPAADSGGAAASAAAATAAEKAAATAGAAAVPAAAAGAPDYTSLEAQGFSAQQAAKGEAAKRRCLQAMRGFCEPVLRVIRDSPPEGVVEHGVYVRPAAAMRPEAFGSGRVVIMGDAAHPLRPTGQGLNTAVEDAWALGRALAGARCGADISLAALDDLRLRRAERLRPIIAFTQASGEAAYRARRPPGGDGGAAVGAAAAEQAAARQAMQPDTEAMSAEEFSRFCYDEQFEPLQQGAAA